MPAQPRPSPLIDALFDRDFYLAANPDVAASGMDAVQHYASFGWREGRRPNPYFDPAHYLAAYPDIAATGAEPLAHYLHTGADQGRNPSPQFDTRFYVERYPDVAASGLNPLLHYLTVGLARGLLTRPEWRSPDGRYVPPPGVLTAVTPLRIEIALNPAELPHLNVLMPGLAVRHMSGGPNTIVQLAYRLAVRGIPVRFVSAGLPLEPDHDAFWRHAQALTGIEQKPARASLADWHDRRLPCTIGAGDLFMATTWWTAQLAKYAVRHTRHRRFVYLIQDYEPLLYPASTQAALAEETYGLDHIGIVNSSFVFEHLARNKAGLYGSRAERARALVFEPAIDERLFYPAPRAAAAKRRLLFYARPSYAPRNLFELGVASLQKAVFDRVLDPAEWEFVGIGESFAPCSLGDGAVLQCAPWTDLEGYARQLRRSDLMLSLMLSPHPSYPPLEMARCGRPVVTTAYGLKTAERLAAISAHIIAVPPTIEAIADGLATGVRRLPEGQAAERPFGYPSSWDATLEEVLRRLEPALRRMLAVSCRETKALPAPVGAGDARAGPR